MKNKYMHTGFTLAELLAVVIIVAILSSLSLGYYKRSVEQARFSEGLSLAGTLVEALNQAYWEDVREGAANATKKRKIATLDFALPNTSACSTPSDYCIKTPHFELQIDEENNKAFVKAYRGASTSSRYYIQVRPVFGSDVSASDRDQIACVGIGTSGKTFCESLGYTRCAIGEAASCSACESGVCIK